MKLSAVINTYNEADKLQSCLDSLKQWINEIIIVDMESIDSVKEIAQKYKTKFYSHPHLTWVEPARNFGISRANGDWILILDPDEIIPQTLSKKLLEITKLSGINAVNIPRQNIIFGKWIAHTNWWPDRQVRFFQKGHVVWGNHIHSYPQVTGTLFDLPAKIEFAIKHNAYQNINEYLTRLNRYTDIEAQNHFEKGEHFSYLNLAWQPFREFLTRYLKHQGYLDGRQGLTLSYLQVIYRLTELIKLWELENVANENRH